MSGRCEVSVMKRIPGGIHLSTANNIFNGQNSEYA